jgi:glycosyltransferase involved in cell wall biosynthesis
MRVLHVVHTLDPAGAGSVEAARLYALLSGDSCRIEVLSLDDDVAPWRAAWPVPVHSAGRAYTSYRYAPSLAPWLRENATRFDAVVVHGVWHYHLPAVSRALRVAAIPYFVILHGMLNPWFKRAYPLKHFKKVLFWRASAQRAIAGAAGVLFLCEEERRLARQAFSLNLQGEALVPLGIRVEETSPELFFDRFPTLRSKRLLLFLGRICFMKGCDLLLDALARVARNHGDVNLVMCGPDQEHWQRDLIRRAGELGIDGRVTWAGPLYGGMKWSALAAAELFVLPSRCETFPISMLEALGSGVPVLVTKDVNIWTAVDGEKAGLVCDATADSISESIGAWLAKDLIERGEFRNRARACFVKHYELSAAFEKHTAVLRAHLRRKSHSEPEQHHMAEAEI